uniref:Uncharacterized protein n=1 Tax=Anguilla anguilla TaxID=7936 RepID=A0A0E9PST4_ANGAN
MICNETECNLQNSKTSDVKRSKFCTRRFDKVSLLRPQTMAPDALQLTSSHRCNFVCNILKTVSSQLRIIDLNWP